MPLEISDDGGKTFRPFIPLPEAEFTGETKDQLIKLLQERWQRQIGKEVLCTLFMTKDDAMQNMLTVFSYANGKYVHRFKCTPETWLSDESMLYLLSCN